MFICLDCGELFEEPAVTYENQGEFWGAPAWEAWGACPNCGSTEYDHAEQCERCGEYFAELEDGLCEFCHDDLYGG